MKYYSEITNRTYNTEKECIEEYNTITPNGYNILPGGETTPINRITPINAKIGVKDSGLHKVTIRLSPSNPIKLNNHDVMVVPILAPIITPMA